MMSSDPRSDIQAALTIDDGAAIPEDVHPGNPNMILRTDAERDLPGDLTLLLRPPVKLRQSH